MAKTDPSEPVTNARGTKRLRGLIVATQRADADREDLSTLLRVGGVTLLERQVRLLQKLGVREVVVLASGHNARLAAEMARLVKLKIDVVLCLTGQAITEAFQTSSEADWLLLDGTALVDFRLPLIFASRKGEQVAVVPLAQVPAADAARGIQLAVSGAPVVFAGCARLTPERIRQLHPDKGEGWLGHLLTAMIADGVAKPTDMTSLPTYLPSMRRDLSYYWLPVRDPEDSRRGQRILLAAAQKGALDWPARYIHPPIEGWIVKHLCAWPVTPNQVTLLCNVVAYVGAYEFAAGSLWWAILVALSVGVLDGVDGRLARVKQLTSRIGGIAEHVCDSIYEYVWQFAIAYRLVAEGHGTIPYMLAGFIVGVDMAEKILLHIFESRRGVPLDDFSPFDRGFRLIVGRRNTYMWTLLIFIAFDAVYVGYWVLALYALMTLLERLGRVGFDLLPHPQRRPVTLPGHGASR
jgi:phosphatidylglycerophosphate synthase